MKKLRNLLQETERRRIAIGHFNVSNLEQLQAVVSAAQKLGAPVIVGVSEGERNFIGLGQIVALVNSYKKSSKAPIFLNADHTHSLEKVKEAAEAGFDSIVFDASNLSFEENLSQTREAVKVAKAVNKIISVEGELGYIGSGSEIRKELPKGAAIRPEDLTKPEEATRFVKETGVDMLAPAVGNIHGMFQDEPNPNLDIGRIKAIRGAASVPLVLHGGSGIKEDEFVKAIDAGISIIHISTELRVVWRKGLETALRDNPGEVSPYKLSEGVIEAVHKVVEEKLKLFNRL